MKAVYENREIKVVFIGESGCGKSTIIRHLAKEPAKLKRASSISGNAGITQTTVEYVFGDFEKFEVISVVCNMHGKQSESLVAFLEQQSEFKSMKQSDENYVVVLNNLVKEYLNSISLEEIYNIINTPDNPLVYISIEVPGNGELLDYMHKNEIDLLKVVDTRGLGDKDNIERNIPIAGTDAIMIIGKNATPNPTIREGLISVCKEYSYIPVLFVGVHHLSEDEVDVRSTDSIDNYLSKLVEFNHGDCPIKTLYAKPCEDHVKLIEPVKKIMKECRINHVPHMASLQSENKGETKSFKFYIAACIETLKNCIKTIAQYQLIQMAVLEKFKPAQKKALYPSLHHQNSFDQIVKYLAITPRDYRWDVDFSSVAGDYSQRNGSPLSYSYDCVAATLYLMLKEAIRNATFSSDATEQELISFYFYRALDQNSYQWYWGYGSGYTYTILRNIYKIVRDCKQILSEQNLELDRVVCKRYNTEYDSRYSIKILLFEQGLLVLLSEINIDPPLHMGSAEKLTVI